MSELPRDGVLKLTGWHGYSEHPITVVSEAAKRYRIRARDSKTVPLPGRVLTGTATALVPKYAVEFRSNEGRSDE